MNSALKNRLVGTIILVALVVILLPEVLDGEKTQGTQEFVDIPSAPAPLVIESADEFPQQTLDEKTAQTLPISNEIALDDPQAIQDASVQANANSTQNGAAVQTSAASPLKIEEPEIEIDVKDSGWVVQLGSFRNEKNVNELISKLKQAGYRAYSQPVRTNLGMLNKVFVGPELERARLEKALPHLEELTKLKGKITAFEVSAE